jgi:uncharacterized membrane protein
VAYQVRFHKSHVLRVVSGVPFAGAYLCAFKNQGQRAMDTLEARHGGTREYSAAEIGALAHLYRGEVYRSTVWRTRLDNTTNWAVAGLGLAMSISFSRTEASALPILLMGVLIVVFLFFEARRYRYFNVWRARCRWLETNFYAPMLLGKGCVCGAGWEKVLSQDYREPQYHISFARALGRRLRRTYCYVLTIQNLAYLGKIIIHPTPVTSFTEFVHRAAIGPIPGEAMLAAGVLFNGAWIIFTCVTYYTDKVSHRAARVSMG